MARGAEPENDTSESRRGHPIATDERQNGMRGTPRSRWSWTVHPDVGACLHARCSRVRGGEGIANRREIFCANRRIRACATRNPTPPEEVFLARVQAVPASIRALSGSNMQACLQRRFANGAKKYARFPDVFFTRAFPRRDARRHRRQSAGCVGTGRRRRMQRAG